MKWFNNLFRDIPVVRRVMFVEPTSYPTAKSIDVDKLIPRILELRKQGLVEFSGILGSIVCLYERKGRETPDHRLRYYSEFGGCGYFSYLIVDGVDVIDELNRKHYNVNALVNEGKVVIEKPVSIIGFWMRTIDSMSGNSYGRPVENPANV